MRASKQFRLIRNHNIALSADIFNFANLLNRNWGVNKSLGRQALYGLSIPASGTTPALPNFDRANARYNYRVNTAGIVAPSGNPYQVQLGDRYNF